MINLLCFNPQQQIAGEAFLPLSSSLPLYWLVIMW